MEKEKTCDCHRTASGCGYCSGTLYAHFRPADAEMQQASAQSGEGGEETQEYGQVAGEYVTAAHLAAVRDLYLVSDKHIRAGYGDRR